MARLPRPVSLVAALFGLLFGGAAAGVGLAALFAPHSWIAQVVSFFALPLAFAAGLQAWYGLAILTLVPRLVARMRGTGRAEVARSPDSPHPLPGSVVFLPLCSGASLVAGLIVGVVSSHPLWVVTLTYWLIGTCHGACAWRLARSGALVPPESG